VGCPHPCHDVIRVKQANIITLINTLNTIVLSGRPIFFGVVLRLFLDEPMVLFYEIFKPFD